MLFIILVFMLLMLVFGVIIGIYLSGYCYLVICPLLYLHNSMSLLGDVECLTDDVAC